MANKQMTSLKIQDLSSISFRHSFPFVVYSLPGESEPTVIMQLKKELNILGPDQNIFNKKGFVIKPFNETSRNPSFIISPDIHFKGHQIDLTKNLAGNEVDSLVDLIEEGEDRSNAISNQNIHETTTDEFTNGVLDVKAAIEAKEIEKAVVSRVSVKKMRPAFSPTDFFLTLSSNYVGAFVYLFHVPDVGCWMGASPELLLSTKENYLETVSLAGTQRNNNQISLSWNDKEFEEQRIVSDHMISCLEKYYTDIESKGPETVLAGPVAHLKTVFKIRSNTIHPDNLNKLLKDMHPTPAIVGSPKQKALDLINSVEKHDRSYYTGFLGPVNMNDKTELFINLRCMQIINNATAIYTGAGITADSNPQLEWDETELKADSLLNILKTNRQYVEQ